MDLVARTLATLDWDAIRVALVDCTRTPMGAERARSLAPLPTRADVLEAYALVGELVAAQLRGERAPVDSVGDVRPELDRAAKGTVLESWSLIAVGRSFAGLLVLQDWLNGRESERLRAFGRVVTADGFATRELHRAFEPDGTLSGSAYPKIGALRSRLAALRASLHDTLASILADEGWGDMLMERYVTERSGRLVVPVKIAHRRGLGIMHGVSASGETAFVEPGQTVELQNDLRAVESELEQETLKVLAELSGMVARLAPAALQAIAAVAQIDLAAGRAELGFRWHGMIPEVGNGGVVALRQARHPLLALRGVPVVGNDLNLDSERCGLVLTGPNAGGKTVALKTIGLAAILARTAIPIPAAEGGRVDFFDPLLADIGDLQSVSNDLSTFSGHLAVLREALALAAPGALVLIDEVAVGTDPAQGAALAGAVLEALVERGARVVITTHYPELKALDDSRIAVSGMEFSEGRPTYRLMAGSPTGSQGLLIAQHMGLPAAVLERARARLDAGAAQLAKLAETLDAERDAVARHSRQLDAQAAALAAEVAALRAREEKVERLLAGERARLVEATRTRLKALEEELRELVKSVHQAPTLQRTNDGLAQLRAARAGLDEQEQVEVAAASGFSPRVGDRVWVLTVQQHGEVLALSGDQAEVQVRAMKLKVPLRQLAPAKDPRASAANAAASAERKAERADARRRESEAREAGEVSVGVRLASNTCDLRGKRLHEAEGEVERFVATLMSRGERWGYLLHGHGTGALKSGLRENLHRVPFVKRWRVAEMNEGGDAFTVVEL